MIVIVAFLLGVLWGGFLARRRQGSRLDIAQYAVAFGIAFAIAGLILTVIIERML
ncbi:MAG: hypothetical protein OEM24_10365 [Paracoccaceae bacterium]|nr:hypothetical protein [Paracoccaceae bacterium]